MSVVTEPTSAAAGSLHGLRVVELGHLIAGPFCGHLFADHGAEVVKVELPGVGDPMRKWGSLYRDVGLYWPLIARGKKSVTLDVRDQRAVDALLDLMATADVLVENFRPGTLERWGLSEAVLLERNPALVVVRVSGFGQTGPARDRAGFGSVAEAMGGLRHLTGEPGRAPVRVGISIGDALAATHAFTGALMALYWRDRPGGSGLGQVVDVALYEAVWMYMESLLPEYEKLGLVRGPAGALLPGIAPSSVYPTADGEWIVMGANQDSVFRRLAEVAGRPEWTAEGSPYATHEGRGERQEHLDGEIAAWTATQPAAALLDALGAAGVPSGRIYTVADIAADPQYRAREMIVSVPEPTLGGEPVPMQGVVPKLSASPGAVRVGGPPLGADNDEIWCAVIGRARLAALRADGVI
jgi:formyl-CoA transferase/succinyl-CoA--D-citramalate CoA-transferase